MQVLKLTKSTENKIELATIVVSIYCILKNINLAKGHILVLSYFVVYGIKKDTKDLIMRSKIFSHRNSIENSLVLFRKKGLVYSDEYGDNRIVDDLKIQIQDKFGIIIKLEN